MCDSVFIEDQNIYCRSIGDLALLLDDTKEIVIKQGYKLGPKTTKIWNTCLCPVDLEPTFKKLGYYLEQDMEAAYTAVRICPQ